MEKYPIKTITLQDKAYPSLLKEIYHPPKILYYRGKLDEPGQYILSVVGTRKPSAYGQRVTRDLVQTIASRNILIVSGLAFGIDALAHAAAIEAGGKTWAILGSGLDQIYPATNRFLAEKILETGGALISDYPAGTPPLKQHFPARNRIIAGLSKGTLIVEAPDKSGALITANFALEDNREVLSVPGEIFNQNAVGTNRLIKQGARPVVDAADILEIFDLEIVPKGGRESIFQPQTQEEKIIVEVLQAGPQTVDQILEKCKLEISIINSTLSVLEMSGKIIQTEMQTYALNL
ncbi:MAG: DNA-processing protein DprA [Patescibacteria group bacterium]|nr:DNA-processing protein DprA [Patescibacteria group bacterium]MDD5567025.1 DNA-processing protein DprA [Patescibacteria group bacterium]